MLLSLKITSNCLVYTNMVSKVSFIVGFMVGNYTNKAYLYCMWVLYLQVSLFSGGSTFIYFFFPPLAVIFSKQIPTTPAFDLCLSLCGHWPARNALPAENGRMPLFTKDVVFQ